MTTPQPTVRAAHARLAALRRWRPEDDPSVLAAKRDLVVLLAAQLTAEAAAMLRDSGNPWDPAYHEVARVQRLAATLKETR